MLVASGVLRSHASPTALHGHDGGLYQVRLVLSDDTGAHRRLLQVAKINEPNDSRMGSAESNRQLAKILVERNQHLAVLRSMGQNLVVARIGAPVTDPLDFMSSPFQLCLCAGPDAAIEQGLQAASSVMAGSIRS